MGKKLGTLRVKFSVITFFTYLTLVGVVMFACYLRFSAITEDSFKNLGDEILSLAAADIKADSIPDYLSGKYDEQEYEDTQERLNRFPAHYKEIYYMYAYSVNDDGKTGTYIFDTEVEHDKCNQLGDTYELEASVLQQIGRMKDGDSLPTIIDKTRWGYLMTCSKPLIDSNGNCQGYIFVDFDLSTVRKNNREFMLKLFLVAFVIMCGIFIAGMRTVAVRITEPIEKMYLCLKDFKYTTAKERAENIENLKSLNIKTNQEIQSLYEALISTTEDSYIYMNEYWNATEKLGVANEKAYTDVLTGFLNKAAYEDKIKSLQRMVDAGDTPEFSVIMVDVNNLKYVNDEYGHKRGDDYIKGCCSVLEKMCTNSLIYRIGGDEFVVVLQDADYRNRVRLYNFIKMYYYDSYVDENSLPWERYSASIGLAEYEPGDTDITDVFKRADSAMYQAKSEFKKKYGSYR